MNHAPSVSLLPLKVVALVAIMIFWGRGIEAEQQQQQEPVATTEFEGGIRISCVEGTCTFNEDCVNLDAIPGVPTEGSSTILEYTEISGDVTLKPASCRAECSGCQGIPGSDNSTAGGCIGSAGFVYCPETDSCIRPWENACPIEGASFVGPVDITCSSGGRCNLSEDCEISVGSFVIGGLYLDGLIGTYSIPEGCTAICQECSNESSPATEDPDGTNEAGEQTSEPEVSGATTQWNVSSSQRCAAFLGFSSLVTLSFFFD